MEKRTNKYLLTLKLLQQANGDTNAEKQLEITVENHDEIFSIIERMQSKNIFENEQQATEFALGLKLFTEVMIKNRKLELFDDLSTAFPLFMKKLKSL